MKPWPILAALSLAILTGIGGYWTGWQVADGRHAAALLKQQKATMEAAEQASRKEAERLEAQAERDALARQLEDQAYADHDGGICSLPVGRVQRLNRR